MFRPGDGGACCTSAMPLERQFSLAVYRLGFVLRFESAFWRRAHDRVATLLIDGPE